MLCKFRAQAYTHLDDRLLTLKQLRPFIDAKWIRILILLYFFFFPYTLSLYQIRTEIDILFLVSNHFKM